MIFWIDKLVLSGSDWSKSSLSLTTSIAMWVGMQVNSDTTSKDTRISSYLLTSCHCVTVEEKALSEGSIAFLDTKTTRQEDGSIAVSVYRKATNTDRYLDFKSHHHPQHKHSVARTLMDRARNIPSTEEEVSRGN